MDDDEDELLCLKAKLFRYDNEGDPVEWKARGKGYCTILKHKTSGLIRILMRRDVTFKICANHYIYPSIELKPNCNSDRAWVWCTTADFSDGEKRREILAIQFADAENAGHFKSVFDKSAEDMKKILKTKGLLPGGDTGKASCSCDDLQENITQVHKDKCISGK